MRFSCEQLQRNLLKNVMQFQFVLLIILSTIWLEIYQVFVFCVLNKGSLVLNLLFQCCILVNQGRLHESSAVCASFTCIWILTLFMSQPWNCVFFLVFFLMTPKWEAVWAPLHTTHLSHNPQALTSKPPLYTSHNQCIHLPCKHKLTHDKSKA